MATGQVMTLEEILSEINDLGWQVNNLFQVDGYWQANLRKDEWFCDFGEGDTPHLALLEAMSKLETAEKAEPEAEAVLIADPKKPHDLLSQLGMTRKIKRRV